MTFITRQRILHGALLPVCATLAAAQSPASADTAPARITAIFAPYARTDAPGCVVGVYRAGTIVFTGAYGMADIAHHVPLTDTTAMWVASASKQFTAFSVLLLEAEGKVRLSDDVRHYIPELPAFGQPITIRELLNHTSGLREQWNLFYMAGWHSSDVATQSDLLWLLHRQRRLNHRPGAEFLYNNTGYSLLALVVERVSGMSFRRFVTERLFVPLGMTRSDVRAEVGQVVNALATGYWSHDTTALRVARVPFSFTGPSGVVTTLGDFARWDANFYAPKVGTVALLDQMRSGGYYSPELDVTWTFVEKAGALELRRHRMDASPLTHLFGDVFQAENFFVLEFSRAARGKAATVDVSTERARRIRFTRSRHP